MILALPQQSSPGVDAQVRDERVRLLYRQAHVTITSALAVAALLAGMMWTRLPLRNVAAWAVFVTITRATEPTPRG